jgi:transcription termination factor Rho
MAVLRRKELEGSPLADLHAIASELGLEGFRAMRKGDLVAAILDAQGGDGDEAPAEDQAAEAPEDAPGEEEAEDEPEPEQEPEAEEPEADEPPAEEETMAGVLDILPNGSGFVRVDPAGQSRGDVYISPAQIRRCELRAGDQVGGPVRPPRRNERHPSLVRVDKVNGRDAEPPEQRPHFSDLTPTFPSERLSGPASLEGVPIGKGSRVAVGGPPGAGATTLLREIAAALAESHSEIELAIALVGVRPEEVPEWRAEGGAPVYGGAFDRSPEAQAQAAELAVERAKRTVERGGDAALIVDSLEALPAGAARRVFGAARKAEEGGSLTIVAATGMASDPQRWATTRVMLDSPAPDSGAPKVSDQSSGTLRAEKLG